ncbi:MAG: hypothetical protein JNM56_01005, partial [Planctomycetia bacterium]|nr:hypothetical protein [Planctomycetia bacterium]
PPPTDEQQEMQMKMMKWMTVFFGFMFYKVAAGLSLYFIISSVWGLAERKLLPKSRPAAAGGSDPDEDAPRGRPDAPKNTARRPKLEKEPEPTGLRAKLTNWWQDVLREASKQQQARRDGDDRGRKKR